MLGKTAEIDVQGLTKRFGGLTAVDGASFSVDKGETLVLLGTSGCGKTTTLKMLNRLVEPTSGKVFIGGKNIRERKPEELRKGIGYVIQDIGLFPHYTVEQNIALVPHLLKWDRKKIRQRVHILLDLVGLPSEKFMRRYPHKLSGGQQQRIGLARAFAADPAVILLDEPFGALDQITRRDIQKEFKSLESFLRKTMILVTHDVFEAFDLGDRICLMDKGKVQQIGTAKELLYSPKNNFVRNFLQANRFLLELQVFTLKDILDEVSKSPLSDKKLPEFNETACLLDVLETLEQLPGKQTFLRILDKDGKIHAEMRAGELLAAFYRIKP
ncbi:MAG: ATP-binding cassette domain-containing protein [Candidatus Aminicenantes bacterium]|nr:ATP-binding cassette domain-containing protein [Candidatus Aminicenantes bacterium]